MRAKGAFPSCALSFTAAVREGHFTAYHSKSENARTVDRARCTERAGARSSVLPREFALLPSARTCDKHHKAPSTRARARRTKTSLCVLDLTPSKDRNTLRRRALLKSAEGNLRNLKKGTIDSGKCEVRETKERGKPRSRAPIGSLASLILLCET